MRKDRSSVMRSLWLMVSEMLYDKARIDRTGRWRGGRRAAAASDARPTSRTAAPTAATAATAATCYRSPTPSLRDLQSFNRRTHYRARRGPARRGRVAAPRGPGPVPMVPVPPGTQVVATTQHACTTTSSIPGQRALAAPRRPGGRGNMRFRDPPRQSPALRRAGRPRARRAGWSCAQAAWPTSARRLPQRRQVDALSRDPAAAEDRRLPVHHRSSPCSARSRRRPPARHRRHPRAHRGRARAPASATTSSRTSSARACSSMCSTSTRWTASTRWTTTRPSSELERHDRAPRRPAARARAHAKPISSPGRATRDAASRAWRRHLGEDRSR